VQRAVQTARGAAKPLLTTLLQAVGDLFAASHQAACLGVLGTITEVFGEVRNAPDIAAAQQQALEGEWTTVRQPCICWVWQQDCHQATPVTTM